MLINSKYSWNWKYLFKYELSSLIGRIFFSKPPTTKNKINLLHLGCGDNYFDEFINADFFYLRWMPWRDKSKYDWLLDFRYPLNCPKNYWDGVFSEHTLEHLTFEDNLKLFKELNQTMKKDSWLRICVPGLDEVLDAYSSNPSQDGKMLKIKYPYLTRAEAIHHLTQDYGHQSVWDADLFTELLESANFRNCQKVSFMKGNDPKLLKDNPDRMLGSIYFEAQK